MKKGEAEMHKLYELKDKLMRELEDYSENGKFSKDDVEAIKYITSAIDHICNISEAEGYSGRYMGGRSYTDARRRDSMGRYSRDGYAYDFKADLEDLMESAPNETVKRKLRDLMRDV